MSHNSAGLERRIPLWVIPLYYIAVSAVFGIALPRLEHRYLLFYERGMSVSTAQTFLAAASSGMMALTAIAFSIAFLVVQFMSTAYSKRTILMVRQSVIIVHALGMCFATFVFALAVLTWVDRFRNGEVPSVSVFVAGVLIIASLVMLALLVHNLADLRVTRVLRTIGDEGREIIARTCTPRDAKLLKIDGVARRAIDVQMVQETVVLSYAGPPRAVAFIDVGALIEIARKARAVLAVHCAVGDTLSDGTPLVGSCGGTVADIAPAELLSTFCLTAERKFENDPKFAMRLLVDTAIMALSPAVNDPTTAVQALDEIEDLLFRLGGSELDDGYAFDSDGQLRVIVPKPTWNDYLALSFDEIRMCGAGSLQVLRRLRSACMNLVRSLADEDRKAAVSEYLEHIDEMIEHSPLDARDRAFAMQEDPQGLGLTRH